MSENAGQSSLELGIAAAKSGSRLVARLRLRDAAERAPEDSLCWVWLAWMAETPAEAVASLQRALALDPDNEIAWAGLRWAQGMAGSPRVDRGLGAATPLRVPPLTVGAGGTPLPPVAPVAPMPAPMTPLPDNAPPLHIPAYTPPQQAPSLPPAAPVARVEPIEPSVPHPEVHVPSARVSPVPHDRHSVPATPERVSGSTGFDRSGELAVAGVTEPGVSTSRSSSETAAAKPPEAASEIEDERPTVLVVDDSPTVCKLVTITLTNNGYRVLSSADGADAVSLISRSRPELILLDITMPRLDGYKLCKLVKSHPDTKHIPVVMLSGKDGFFDKTRGRLAGCTDYITKPFDPETLLQAVRRYLPTSGPETLRSPVGNGRGRRHAGLS